MGTTKASHSAKASFAAPPRRAGERRELRVPGWEALTSIAASVDGERVVAGEKGGYRCCCWRADGTLLWQSELMAPDDRRRYSQQVRVALLPAELGGDALALAPYHDALFVLDGESGAVQRRDLAAKGARAFAVAPDGATLTLRAGTEALLLRYPSLEPLGVLEGYTNRDEIIQSVDGRFVVTIGPHLRVFERATRREVAFIEREAGPRSGAFSPDGNELAVAYQDGALRCFDTASWQMTREADSAPERKRKPEPSCLRYDPRGRLLAVAGDDGSARLLDAETLAPTQQHKKHVTAIPDTGARRLAQVEFSASGRWLFVSALRKAKAEPGEEPAAGISAYGLASGD